MNDPWTPKSPANIILPPAPIDPLHQLISSDRYLDTLEKKLGRLKGSAVAREPTSQDIVKTLSKFRDDQMEHFMKGETTQSGYSTDSGGEVTTTSYLQRRLYPEKQPLTEEELVVLLQDDALAKRVAEEEEEEKELLGLETKATEAVTKQQENTLQSSDPVSKATISLETVSLKQEESPKLLNSGLAENKT